MFHLFHLLSPQLLFYESSQQLRAIISCTEAERSLYHPAVPCSREFLFSLDDLSGYMCTKSVNLFSYSDSVFLDTRLRSCVTRLFMSVLDLEGRVPWIWVGAVARRGELDCGIRPE